MLDIDTLRAIKDADGEFQVSIWPKRTKSGLKVLRIHIEPPYEGGAEDADLDDDDFDGPAGDSSGDDDIPF